MKKIKEMKKIKGIICGIAAMALTGSVAFAQSGTRSVEPCVSAGIGLWLPSLMNDTEGGLAIQLSAGLDINMGGAWSVMPAVAYRELADWDGFSDKVGSDNDDYSFVDLSVSARYHAGNGWTVGIGPYYSVTTRTDSWYIDADPTDPIGGCDKIKRGGYGIQPSADYRIGEHWKLGVLANIGLNNMRVAYPTYKSTEYISSVLFTVGFTF